MKLDGIFLVMIAALWFSAGSMTIKALGPEVPVAWVAFVRNLVAVPFLLAAMQIKGYAYKSDHWFRLILRGVFGCLGMVTFFWSLPRLPLATVILLHCTAPLFAALWGVLFLGEKLDRFSLGCIAMAFLGVYVTLRPSLDMDSIPYYVALSSGLFSSLAFATIKALTKTEKPIRIIFYFAVIGSVIFLPGALTSGFTPSLQQGGMMIAVGLVTTVGQLFLTWGIGAAPVSKASLGSLFRIVANITGGWIIFNEVPEPWTWLGCALVMSGILSLTSGLRRRILVAQ